MRLKIRLSCVSKPRLIPVNYNYQLSAAVYLLLKFGSPEFSQFLHDSGYKIDKKNFKLFTFALKFHKYSIVNNKEYNGVFFDLLSPEVDLLIASPLVDTFIKNFVIGTFEKQHLYILYKGLKSKFIIKYVELIPDPVFTEEMSFILLNPLVLPTIIEYNGRLATYYLRYDDRGVEDNIKNNLLRKYRLLYEKEIKPEIFKIEFDQEDYKRRNGNVSKLITIAEGSQYESKIKGIMCDFKIKTDPELIKVGYECGFGGKNSMGFGFVELKTNKNKINDMKGELYENIQNE